jgi:hypothetical protein
MACLKLPFLIGIVKDFVEKFSHLRMFFLLPSGVKISYIEDKEKYIRRLRKS